LGGSNNTLSRQGPPSLFFRSPFFSNGLLFFHRLCSSGCSYADLCPTILSSRKLFQYLRAPLFNLLYDRPRFSAKLVFRKVFRPPPPLGGVFLGERTQRLPFLTPSQALFSLMSQPSADSRNSFLLFLPFPCFAGIFRRRQSLSSHLPPPPLLL